MISDTKGDVYSGKTIEYAAPLPFEMTYVPAGTKVNSIAPGNKPGLSFETKWSSCEMRWLLAVGVSLFLAHAEEIVSAVNPPPCRQMVNSVCGGLASESFPFAPDA